MKKTKQARNYVAPIRLTNRKSGKDDTFVISTYTKKGELKELYSIKCVDLEQLTIILTLWPRNLISEKDLK